MNADNTTLAVPPLLYNQPNANDYPSQHSSSSWQDALSNILSFVEEASSSSSSNKNNDPPIVLFKNKKYVCLYDKYPKAEYHCLLLPRNGILRTVSSINELTPHHHLPSIQEFHAVANSIVHELQKTILLKNNDKDKTITLFKLGYHAIPSLTPLHLHIISTDFDSTCIKTKRHVNSFTSPFFIDAETLEEHLESAFFVSSLSNTSLFVDVRRNRAENLVNGKMKCVKCQRVAVNVPDWKRHNQVCTSVVTKDGKKRFNVLLGWTSREYYGPETGSPKQQYISWIKHNIFIILSPIKS